MSTNPRRKNRLNQRICQRRSTSGYTREGVEPTRRVVRFATEYVNKGNAIVTPIDKVLNVIQRSEYAHPSGRDVEPVKSCGITSF
jgi:hypothetical protein